MPQSSIIADAPITTLNIVCNCIAPDLGTNDANNCLGCINVVFPGCGLMCGSCCMKAHEHN